MIGVNDLKKKRLALDHNLFGEGHSQHLHVTRILTSYYSTNNLGI